VSDWFFMLGEPLGDSEREQVRGYLNGLGLDEQTPVESVPDFAKAARIISHPDWDRRWWDAEQHERARLRAKAAAVRGSGELLLTLSQSTEESLTTTHGAAAVQAARLGCRDPALIRAAAGALAEALYLAKLAELAGEAASHPFLSKRALFAGGHWPLGLVWSHFYLF
jgi:hypothetical protein